MNLFRDVVVLCACPLALLADSAVLNSLQYAQQGSSVHILSGSIDLPSSGIWSVDAVKTPEALEWLALLPPEAAYDQLEGRRMGQVELEKNIRQSRYRLSSLNWGCLRYAKEHEGRGPSVIADLDPEADQYAINSFKGSPWDTEGARAEDGPFFFLVPEAEFICVDNETRVRAENRKLLAFELRPYVGDGKHWVCYTDGTCRREDVVEERMAQYGQSIRPVFAEAPHPDHLPPTYTYTVIATRSNTNRIGAITVPLENTYTEDSMDISWDFSGAKAGDASVLEELREFHKGDWWSYLSGSASPVLQTWLALTEEEVEQRGRRGENISAFGVMGGYAAVRETLQMQLIDAGKGQGEQVVPIESIEGVKVKSHPYEEMLAKQEPPPRMELAECVPADHFFVYAAKPKAMLPLLDDGADFVSELGNMLTGSSIKYYLKDRYLKRLGTNEQWLKAILMSGGIKVCALMTPDLFFIDGTEITVVSRIANTALINPLLKVMGISDLSGGEIVAKRNSDGNMVYWAVRGDLLIISTSEAEMLRVLELNAAEGKGSLGQSAEFRYMLTQLSINSQTRCYAYCSDPFIRRLVGPAVKIGQLRRVEAMNRMRQLTAGALLAHHDGFGKIQSLEQLRDKGYLVPSFPVEGLSLDSGLAAHSETYGTLQDLRSVESVPVVKATEQEAKRYREYVRNYSRFWRQFFDPIAVRLDDKADGALEATMFILPLIDSSMYNGIKQFVMAQESGVPLKTPRVSPDPVLQFSVNLKEAAWQSVSEGLSDLLSGYVYVDPAIVDDLGPSVHLFVNDADPVISLGSGDILGAFGGRGFRMNDEMMFIPFLASVLTRSCTIAVETSQPEKTVAYLRNATGASFEGLLGGDELRSQIYQIEDRDSWVCLFDIMGALKLRYGLEVKDGFLMIRNIPWSSKDRITQVGNASLNGMGLKVYPAACRQQLPGLHSAAFEKSRAAAFTGMGHLFPLVSSGYTPLGNARELHMKLFGFAPFQAADDTWTWEDGLIESSKYGSIYEARQEAYTEGDEGFGLMGSIEEVGLEMQFEHTGLRTKLRWKTREQ